MLRVQIDGVTATVTEQEILTAGRVGLECAFTFSGEWTGLFKTAVFEGNQTVDVALDDTNTCIVPWEALEVEGFQLRVGVYGANGDGDIVIPTVWANFGKIQPSAIPSGVDPQTPSQNANAYAVETAEQALSIAQGVETRANNGDFDGADGQDGVSPIATVEKVFDTATITITDSTHTTTATITDGEDGDPGSQIWTSTAEPSHVVGIYTFNASNLKPARPVLPKAGDLILYGNYLYTVTEVSGSSVKSDTGSIARVYVKGNTGATGAGIAAGGTTSQVLAKASATDYDVEWVTPVAPYASNPAALGSASPGLSNDFSRGDHVHPLPSAADVGAYVKPTGGIPKSDLAAAVQTSLGRADTALQSAPVTSVNGQTGDVTVNDAFTAEYGVTLIEDILAAIAADKVVVVVDSQESGGRCGQLFSYDDDMGSALFIMPIDGLADRIIIVDSNGWHSSVVDHPSMDDTYEPFATGTGSGATVSFADGAGDIPLKYCSVNIDFEQTGSGDPSENNIRPITMYNEVNIVVSPTSSADDGVTYEFDLSDNPVCKGTLNTRWGNLTETKVCCSLTGNEAWTLSTTNGYRRFYKSLSALGWPAIDTNHATEAVSSHFKRKSSSTQTTDTFGVFRISQDGYVVLPDNGSRFASAAELKAWFAEQYANETPVQFAYVPDETETYSVDPQDIFTCLGTNYVWADTGDTALTYRKDPNIALSDAHEIAYVTYGTGNTTSAEVEALWQAGKTIYCEVDGSFLRCVSRASSTTHVFAAFDGSYCAWALCNNDAWGKGQTAIPIASTTNPAALGTASYGSSTKYAREDHVHPLPAKYTTLTIATTDWSSLSCTKTVTGMTSTAIVWLEYSDTTTAFTCTQGTDSLTFGCDSTPSASVTVKVAFMEGISL